MVPARASKGQPRGGVFATGANVRTDATVDAIRQFLKRWTATARTGRPRWSWPTCAAPSPQQDVLSYETLGQKAGFLLQMIMRDLEAGLCAGPEQPDQNGVTETLKASAARWLDPAEMVIVVVGDKSLKTLSELHLPILSTATARGASQQSCRPGAAT